MDIIDINIDLYKILDINKESSLDDIKKAYKKQALLYHPDKHLINDDKQKDIITNKFREIRLAYEILSDENKRNKYDIMTNKQKTSFIDKMIKYFNELNKITNSNNIIKDILGGNNKLDNIQDKIIEYLLSKNKVIFTNNTTNIEGENDIKLEDIFFPYSDNPTKYQDNLDSFEKYNNSSSELELNTLNIIGQIETTLEDIYNNKFKEVSIRRKIIDVNDITLDNTSGIFSEKKYHVPLFNSKIIIENGGDYNKMLNKYGNVIINVLQKKHRKFKRINHDIIYNDNITLFSLFTGFIKEIKYFNDEIIELSSSEPLEEFHFDGNKLKIIIKNKGLPYDIDGSRGNLIIYLYLLKDQNFYKNLKLYYSK